MAMRPPLSPVPQKNARERLVEAAERLYRHTPVHRVGVEVILSDAGVAKATLYKFYGSKEGLTREIMLRASRAMRAELTEFTTRNAAAGEIASFIESCLNQGFGAVHSATCLYWRLAFQADVDDVETGQLMRAHANSMHEILVGWGKKMDAREPQKLAHALAIVLDGAAWGFYRDRDPSVAQATQDAIIALLKAHLSVANLSEATFPTPAVSPRTLK